MGHPKHLGHWMEEKPSNLVNEIKQNIPKKGDFLMASIDAGFSLYFSALVETYSIKTSLRLYN